jgi:heptosyltransferase II
MPADPTVKSLLVVQPSWVGDAVMATPTLRALRSLYPSARIAYLFKKNLAPVFAGMPWADEWIPYEAEGTWRLSRELKSSRFDTGVLLANSFRTALLCRLAGVKRIVGYAREGRTMLLTDRLQPPREKDGSFTISPIIHYYLAIARYLGSDETDLSMQLFVTPDEEREATDVMARAGIDRSRPRVVLNPGAQYGAAKCWLPEYFAEASDRLQAEFGAQVIVSSAPRERPIVDEIARHAKKPFIDLAKFNPSFGAVKAFLRTCDLMLTNDTGPRHIAAAFGVPVVTLFGPTHPDWTQIYFPLERQLAVKVDCGPCQLKKCPLDHRCMKQLTPGMALQASAELLQIGRAGK